MGWGRWDFAKVQQDQAAQAPPEPGGEDRRRREHCVAKNAQIEHWAPKLGMWPCGSKPGTPPATRPTVLVC